MLPVTPLRGSKARTLRSGPPSSGETWGILRRGPRGHVAIMACKQTDDNVEMAPSRRSELQ
jgi:hypothetical protein